MIGIVLVTHGELALEFRKALEHVVGQQECFATVCIGADDDMEAKREEISDAIDEVETGSGVIILTDLFGGTPSNMSISLMKDRNVEVIAGINLPMLVKLASARNDSDLAEVSETAQDAGRKYIHVASKVLEGRE
ncbi:MAG: PTS sugar transporter subunit IIA [Pseudomonadota bacterium]